MQTTTKLELLDPATLIPTAGNPRVHSQRQLRELRASLRAYGVVSPVLIDRDRNIIAGHAVVEAALAESCASHRRGCALAKRANRLRGGVCGSHRKDCALAKQRKCRLRGGRTRGAKPMVSPLLRITPLPSGRAARAKVMYLLAVATQSAGSEQPCRHTPQRPPLHPPQSGCTGLSGGKSRYHLCGSPSASAPRFSCAAVPVGSRGACRPGLGGCLKGKRAIDKREKTAGCLPLVRLRRAAAHFPCFAKAPSPAVKTAHLGGEIKADDYEPCLYGWDARASHRWYGGDGQGTVFFCDKPQESAEHPTMKPVELFARQIRNSTRKGEIVLDPFCGSGTSVLAAETYDRKCRAMELSPHNCDVILARWEQMTGHAAVLLEGGAADARAETTD